MPITLFMFTANKIRCSVIKDGLIYEQQRVCLCVCETEGEQLHV
jgi:hypothetical protein